MRILSLFDGISGCRQALKELNIDCDYYSSEIDRFAIQISKANHPDIIQIGNVKGVHIEDGYIFYNQNNNPMENGGSFKADIDLLIGGFPCQSFSIAGNRKGFEDERGNLFFEALRILKEVKPKYFIFENVNSMSKVNKAIIDEKLGVGHVMINSALATAQQRKRVYWVGKLVNGKYEQVKIEQPEDQKIYLKDIIEEGFVDRDKSYCIDANYHKGGNLKSYFEKGRRQLVFDEVIATQLGNSKNWGNATNSSGKAFTLRASQPNGIIIKGEARKLTPIECCRLQGFPDNYVSMVSNTQGYKALGNSFTVPIIKHILKSVSF